MNDLMYEILQRRAAAVAFREHTSYDYASYASAREKYRQKLLTKDLNPGYSHSSEYWYLADVLEKYDYHLERGKEIGISDPKYVSQFSNKVSYTEITSLTYYEIADLIYRRRISSDLPIDGQVYFYGCKCRVPIYPVKSLFVLPEVQTELKKRIYKHYLRSKIYQVDISSISFELKDVDGGDYLIISLPKQINYKDSLPLRL